MFNLTDPFDLDDHRPRVATELDDFIAAGVREVEVKREREADPDPRIEMDRRIMSGFGWRPDLSTFADIAQWCERDRKRKAALDSPDTLTRAWEAASGEGQVVS